MRYAKLGHSGLDVSRVVLGCMSWGDVDQGWHPWILDEDAARTIIRQALESGITTFDTANVYAGGSSETTRSQTDEWGADLYLDEDRAIVDTVATVAERLGASRAQVGLAWLLHQCAVTAPIVGVTKPAHLTDAVAAVDLELSDDDLAVLGAGYHPRPVSGHD
jgi:aryl-alcohol dehydrogenase-like predicted oxidoreductase